LIYKRPSGIEKESSGIYKGASWIKKESNLNDKWTTRNHQGTNW